MKHLAWKLADWIGLYVLLVTISATTFHWMSHGGLSWPEALSAALLANIFKTVAVKGHNWVLRTFSKKGDHDQSQSHQCDTKTRPEEHDRGGRTEVSR